MTEPPLKICAGCGGNGCAGCAFNGVGIPLRWLAEHEEWEIYTADDGLRYVRHRTCDVVDVKLGPPCGKDVTGRTEAGEFFCDLHSCMAAQSGDAFYALNLSELERAQRRREIREVAERVARDLANDDV